MACSICAPSACISWCWSWRPGCAARSAPGSAIEKPCGAACSEASRPRRLRPKHKGKRMVEVTLGAATATRIEESYEPNFDAKVFFPDWNAEVVREHGGWMSPNHY